MLIQLAVFIATLIVAIPAVADERESCRLSQDEKRMVECLEKGVYDPCDDASPGSHGWITAQCAWAHAEVANRKIVTAEGRIIARLKKAKAISTLTEFRNSQHKWRDFVDYYCRFTNHADEVGVFANDPVLLSYGFCLSRHNEQRAKELEAYLARPE